MPSVKLSFGEVMSESFGFFFANLRLFFHLVTVPWIISLAIRIVGSTLDRDSLMPALLQKGVDTIPAAMFMVAWHRVVLLGSHRVDLQPGLGWTPRETAFLVHLVKVAGITFVLLAAFVLAVGTIDPALLTAGPPTDPEIAKRHALAAPLGVGFMVSILLALRVSYGLAGTSVDVPFTPRLSWAFSRGNGWTVIGVLFVIFFAGTLVSVATTLVVLGLTRGVMGANEAAAVITWTAEILVSYGGLAVAATAQAVIFRRQLSWREGTPLPAVS